MKNSIFCIISMMLLMINSCSDNYLVKPGRKADQKGLAIDNGSDRKPGGRVITVRPNGTDDTGNLVQAFADAKSAGPGSTVQLVSGIYNIGMIEVREFDGFFRGAGKDKTIISNLPDLPCEEAFEQNVNPALLKFIGGNINVSDFTIHIKDGDPCAYGPINASVYGDLESLLMFSDFGTLFVPAHRQVKAIVNNVDFISGNDGGHGTYGTEGNVGLALFCSADIAFPSNMERLSNGEISVSDCYFENALCGPDFFGFDENSTICLAGNTVTGGFQQIFIGALYGTRVTVINNKFRNGMLQDLFISDNEWTAWYYSNLTPVKQSEYKIIGNDFQSPSGIISLYMEDHLRTENLDGGYPQRFEVKGNNFNTHEGGIAILGLDNVGAKIWNNKFSGTGSEGIMLDGDAATNTFAENIMIIGNNYFDATYADANVYLGFNTMNCTVTGVAAGKVIDNGINNSVIGDKSHKKGTHYQPLMIRNIPGLRRLAIK